MAQGMIGGATSYEEQSLIDILIDIENWIKYTSEKKLLIIANKDKLLESGFWDKISFDFQMTINTTIFYFDTILYDLGIVKNAIGKNCIIEKDIVLLRNIGRKAILYNREYGKTYKEERDWHDYRNPDFFIAEEIYGKGRDYFVTMQDAENAACRLEDYMEKGHVVNNTMSFSGNVTSSQIQQGTIGSTQSMTIENKFDYDKVMETLIKIKKTFNNIDLQEEFGANAEQIKTVVLDTIQMVEKKKEPTKIKKALSIIKDLTIGISGSIIASGICGLIAQLPIW